MKKIKLLIMLSIATLFLGKANVYATSGGQQKNVFNKGQQSIEIDENSNSDDELRELPNDKYVFQDSSNAFDEEKFNLITRFFGKLKECGILSTKYAITNELVKIRKAQIQSALDKLLALVRKVSELREQLAEKGLENSDIKSSTLADDNRKKIQSMTDALNEVFDNIFLSHLPKKFVNYALNACAACRAKIRSQNYEDFKYVVSRAEPILKEFIEAIEKFKNKDNDSDDKLRELLNDKYVFPNSSYIFDKEKSKEKCELVTRFCSRLKECGLLSRKCAVKCAIKNEFAEIKKKHIQHILEKLLNLVRKVSELREQLVADNLQNSDITPNIIDNNNAIIDAVKDDLIKAFKDVFSFDLNKDFTLNVYRACATEQAEVRSNGYRSFECVVSPAVQTLKEFIEATETFKKKGNGNGIKPLKLKNKGKEKKAANLLYNNCKKQNEFIEPEPKQQQQNGIIKQEPKQQQQYNDNKKSENNFNQIFNRKSNELEGFNNNIDYDNMDNETYRSHLKQKQCNYEKKFEDGFNQAFNGYSGKLWNDFDSVKTDNGVENSFDEYLDNLYGNQTEDDDNNSMKKLLQNKRGNSNEY